MFVGQVAQGVGPHRFLFRFGRLYLQGFQRVQRFGVGTRKVLTSRFGGTRLTVRYFTPSFVGITCRQQRDLGRLTTVYARQVRHATTSGTFNYATVGIHHLRT